MIQSSVTATLIGEVIAYLNQNVDYAVMRNYEGLPHSNSARDIDIIIRRRDLKRVQPHIIDIIDKCGWKIINYLNSDRLITYVCARNDGNGTSIMQWDFFVDTSVFGILLMKADEFLCDKEFNGFLWHSKVNSQFLDKYLYDRAVGAEYPEKYHSTRSSAENSPAVRAKLKAIFGIDNTDQCDSTSGRKLLFRAFRYNLRHRPFGLMADMGRFIRTFTGNYILSRTGFSVGFTGPDGSGKTTVIDRTIQRLGAVFATAHAYYHFRPALFGNLGEVAHSAGIKKDVDRNYSDPHRGGRTGLFSSLMRLVYYSTDYIAGYFAKVKTKTRITRLVIFDRYFTDIICDSRRSRIYLPVRFLNLWRKLFIPSLDYNILLTASSETILSRKRELDEAGIRDINNRIDYLADQKGYLKVLNESTPDDAVTTTLNHIFNEQHKKNLRRLKLNNLKIFVSAYACEPGLGSEIGVGWHWVLEMSKYFELWVLTRESNRHSIEPWIREHPEYSGIHFLYYDLPKWARFWKRGLRGVRTYYNIWQKMTDRIVRETMQTNGIKVFHHLTYGNALWPVSAYGSRQKFIWGPIGGLETIPGDYSRHYSRKSRLIERLRRLSVGISVRSRALKNRALRADLILCKTELTKNLLPADARLNAVSFTDVAPDTAIAAESPSIAHSGLCCIAVGRLDAWRGFDIAILAVAKALKTCPDIRLAIVGKGVDRPRLEELASKLGISEHVTFFGAVPAEIYRQLMNDTDIVLNPSLKEGAVTVSFDAMAMGKPLIALDTTGYTRYFHPDFSVVIPREDRDTTINAFADAIIRLSDPALRSRMGLQAKEAAKEITWQHHGEEIRDIILRHIDFN